MPESGLLLVTEKLGLAQEFAGVVGCAVIEQLPLASTAIADSYWYKCGCIGCHALSSRVLANLQQLYLFDNMLNAEAIAYLVNGGWPLLRELGLSWTCVPEAGFKVLCVVNARKQFESTQPNYTHGIEQRVLLRSSFLVWPKLKELTINLPLV